MITSDIHVLGDVSQPEDVVDSIFEEISSGDHLLDLSAGQLSSPHTLKSRVFDEDKHPEVQWMKGQQYADVCAEASRRAYVEWLAQQANEPIERGKSIKEWFVYDDEISLWWFTRMSRKHPVNQPHRWLFYQIFVIRHLLNKGDSDMVQWHLWVSNRERGYALRAALPESSSVKVHHATDSLPSTWKDRLRDVLEATRIGETVLALKDLFRSIVSLFREVRHTAPTAVEAADTLFPPEARERPLILVHTLFPSSWKEAEPHDRFRDEVASYDHYLADVPWRLQERGYNVAWLPSTLYEDGREWKRAKEKQTLADARPWMAFTWRDFARVLSHQVIWVFLYIWLFVWKRVHETWTYEGVPLGAWLKSSYRWSCLTYAFVEIEKYRTACEELQPEAVLYRDEFYPGGRRPAAAMKEMTVMVGMQHGMISQEHTVYQWDERDIETPVHTTVPNHVQYVPAPDYFAAFGSHYVEQFGEWGGYPSENVVPIGGLRHDSLVEQFNLRGKKFKLDKQKSRLRDEQGLPQSRPVILLCTGLARQAGERVRLVVQGLRKSQRDAFVAVKLHQYHGGEDRVRAVARELGFSSFGVYTQGVYPLMAASDILVAGASTTVLEGNLFGLYCITVSNECYEVYPFSRDALADVVSDTGGMAEALDQGIEEVKNGNPISPNLERHLRNRDGYACRRLAEMLSQPVLRNGRE